MLFYAITYFLRGEVAQTRNRIFNPCLLVPVLVTNLVPADKILTQPANIPHRVPRKISSCISFA